MHGWDIRQKETDTVIQGIMSNWTEGERLTFLMMVFSGLITQAMIMFGVITAYTAILVAKCLRPPGHPPLMVCSGHAYK